MPDKWEEKNKLMHWVCYSMLTKFQHFLQHISGNWVSIILNTLCSAGTAFKYQASKLSISENSTKGVRMLIVTETDITKPLSLTHKQTGASVPLN